MLYGSFFCPIYQPSFSAPPDRCHMDFSLFSSFLKILNANLLFVRVIVNYDLHFSFSWLKYFHNRQCTVIYHCNKLFKEISIYLVLLFFCVIIFGPPSLCLACTVPMPVSCRILSSYSYCSPLSLCALSFLVFVFL